MKKEIKIGMIIVFAALSASGITWYINEELEEKGFKFYDCGEEYGMPCWKLSGGKHTWCYYNDSSPKKYQVCSSGWTLHERDIIGYENYTKIKEVTPESKVIFDSINFTDYCITDLNCSNVSCDIIRVFKKDVVSKRCNIKGNDNTPDADLQNQIDECEAKALSFVEDKERKREIDSYPKTLKIKGVKKIIT